MKNLIILFFFLRISTINGQIIGNEWYDSGDQYLKFTINENGIYRINKLDLNNAGLSTDGKLLKHYRLFYKGQEMKIKVSGNPDLSIGDNDFVEFFAEKNSGWQDVEVHRDPTKRANPYYSLYTDETSYFLSINGTIEGKRINNTPIIDNGIAIENYYIHTIIKNFSNDWIYDALKCFPPNAVESKFENYEGVCSPIYFKRFNVDGTVLAETAFNENVILPNYLSTVGIPIVFESQITTRNLFSSNVNYNIGGVTGSVSSDVFFKVANINSTVASIAGNTLSLFMNTTGTQNNDFWSIYFYKIKYSASPVFQNNSFYEFKNNNSNNNLRLQLSSSPSTVYGYSVEDIFNQNNIEISTNSGTSDIYFTNNSNSNKIFLSSILKKPKAYKIITFNKPSQDTYSFLMVTDSRLMTSGLEYKTYRQSAGGGGYNVLLVDVKDLYDQYSFGEKNPIAIRRFVDYMTRNTPNKVKYLLLIGKSVSEPARLKLRELANQPANDFVPTFGYPASDVLFTSGLLGFSPSIAAIPTGRISAKSDADVTNYLNKVKEHESAANKLDRAWQKNMLHLAGPKSQSEYTSLVTASESFRKIANESIFAANAASFVTINKPLSSWTGVEYGGVAVDQTFYDKVNAGVGIINYFGHGTPVSVSHNFGFTSKQTPVGVGGSLYTNKGKYPFLIANGCGIANGFRDQDDIASDWINTANKGAINTLSQTYLSYEAYDERTMLALYNSWFGPKVTSGARPNANMVNESIGNIVQAASILNASTYPGSDPTAPSPDAFFVSNLQQTMLLGDPSVAIFNTNIAQPLDLELSSIKVITENNQIVIDWKTFNEVLVNGFDIERSFDSKKFEKIGFVKARNNESNDYSFVDNNPIGGVTYYRLKLLDLDGTFRYSPIKSVLIDNSNFKIFENPTQNNYFEFTFNEIDTNKIKLISNSGKNVSFNLANLGNDKYRIEPNGDLANGVYFLKIENKSGFSKTNKLVVKK